MQELLGRLKAISDLTRLKILKLIMEREFSVCELAKLLNISQPAVSQHLRRLKAVGLAEDKRRGQWIYYQTSKDSLLDLASDLTKLCQCQLADLAEFKEIMPLLANVKDLERDCQSPNDNKN